MEKTREKKEAKITENRGENWKGVVLETKWGKRPKNYDLMIKENGERSIKSGKKLGKVEKKKWKNFFLIRKLFPNCFQHNS